MPWLALPCYCLPLLLLLLLLLPFLARCGICSSWWCVVRIHNNVHHPSWNRISVTSSKQRKRTVLCATSLRLSSHSPHSWLLRLLFACSVLFLRDGRQSRLSIRSDCACLSWLSVASAMLCVASWLRLRGL
ncbi:hypothetical protein BKA80DRAFT_278381, partial [Phyllosticta citrichinensis]